MRGKLWPVIGSLVFFLIAPAVVAGWVPYWLTAWEMGEPFPGSGAARGVGIVLIAIGVVSLIDCFARFALQGRGTPAPVAPTQTLVVSGLYRYVRNPMYVAVLSIILGQALLLGSVRLLQYAGFTWLFFFLFVRLYEEPTLRRQFGESYRVYQSHVRRWWPRLRPWQADKNS